VFFQILDFKEQCAGVYFDGQLSVDDVPKNKTVTWDYSPALKNKDIQYMRLYCNKTLAEACPDNMREKWNTVTSKMRAFISSFHHAKINLNDTCFYDLMPEHFLLEYFDLKNKITEHVFKNYEKPENYEFLVDMQKVLADIKSQNLQINSAAMKPYLGSLRARNFVKALSRTEPYCKYNLFGTITGRLSTFPGSFPILTMNKEYRTVLNPTNDCYLELDYNAAELRTFLSLSGHKQPQNDIHEWNQKNIFKDDSSREDAKQRIFSWLYSNKLDIRAEKVYNKDKVRSKYWDGQHVETVFGRKIQSDEHHALNYIIQSTTSDLVLRQMIKLYNFLEDKKSFIAFCIHDSVVIDLDIADKGCIKEIMEIFSDTALGSFKVTSAIGLNFGDMRELKI
tara:strand:+ start:356 stop:1537 length:1182 start_codon:yes stop_codon:yes gene_type:complete